MDIEQLYSESNKVYDCLFTAFSLVKRAQDNGRRVVIRLKLTILVNQSAWPASHTVPGALGKLNFSALQSIVLSNLVRVTFNSMIH